MICLRHVPFCTQRFLHQSIVIFWGGKRMKNWLLYVKAGTGDVSGAHATAFVSNDCPPSKTPLTAEESCFMLLKPPWNCERDQERPGERESLRWVLMQTWIMIIYRVSVSMCDYKVSFLVELDADMESQYSGRFVETNLDSTLNFQWAFLSAIQFFKNLCFIE